MIYIHANKYFNRRDLFVFFFFFLICMYVLLIGRITNYIVLNILNLLCVVWDICLYVCMYFKEFADKDLNINLQCSIYILLFTYELLVDLSFYYYYNLNAC